MKIYVIAVLLLFSAFLASCVTTNERGSPGDLKGKRLTIDRN